MTAIETKSVTLNEAQRLYVIPSGKGYSCLGFDVCERRTVALARELASLGVDIPQPAPLGSLERYNQYQAFVSIASGFNQRNGWRSQSELAPQLVGLEGKRVENRAGRETLKPTPNKTIKMKIPQAWIYVETSGYAPNPQTRRSYFVSTGNPGGARFDTLEDAKQFAATIAESFSVVG